MSNYVIGIYDDRNTLHNQSLGNKYKELTEFFIRHMKTSTNNFIVEKSINDVLNKALEKNIADYCVVMAIGHFINSPNFFRYIEAWIEKTDFFITGHIIDKESNNSQENSDGHYWGLHKQCMVINLRYYEEFGKPNWGDKFVSEERIKVAKAKRSKKDIHDDYTPVFLEPTKETQVCTPHVDGWNFINVSLQKGLKVYNFHPKIRNTKRYSYPNKDVNELRKQLNWINNILTGAPNCVFFWNTEIYKDILSYCTENKNKQPVKKFYSVAAAFKPNFLLEKIGFTEDTEITYFDYSKQALAFKKYLIENWDGTNYSKFLRAAKQKYSINETFGSSTEGKEYEELWEREIKNWETEKSLYNHWQKYRKLKHNYIHCDVLIDPEKLIDTIDNTDNSYIWWSNAFHTVTAHYTMTLADLTNHYNNNWVHKLEEKNKDLVVFGADILNNKLQGVKVGESLYKENIDESL